MRSTPRLVWLLVALAGCAHAQSEARGPDPGALQGYSEPAPMPTAAPASEVTSYDFDDEQVSGDRVRPDGMLIASAAPPAPPAVPPPPPAVPEAPSASDAMPAGPVLVYTASFHLSVYEVDSSQRALKAAVQKLGGFVSAQTDSQLTLRVPAQHFESALAAIENTGKVRARNVQALDVGDQYRDLNIRLRTAEAMRTRFEAMLARADKVEDALMVEKELERVVREIELLKGQLRSLSDRIAYSMLVVAFTPEGRPDLDDSDVIRLPYPWLSELGLPHLLELAP